MVDQDRLCAQGVLKELTAAVVLPTPHAHV
jgi:hypothetical protein